MEVFNINFS